MTSNKYTLFGVEGSYYAAKARCYLLQKPLPFDDVVADRKVFEEIIMPRIGYPIVPVVLTPDGDILQDTAVIVETLEKRHPENPLIPTTPKKRFAAYLLELFADEWLKIPALHYRWYYDTEFAQQMMGSMNDPEASPEEQLRVGKKIAKEFSTWPQHLGARENTKEAVENLFMDYLRLLDTHFEHHEYLLGKVPSLADCAFMGPLYAHLYRDPYSGKIVRDKASKVCQWISRMRTPAAEDEARDPLTAQDAVDNIPPLIIDLMKLVIADYAPMIAEAVSITRNWISEHKFEELPRYLGEHSFTLGTNQTYEAQGVRSVHAVEQWKFQRLLQKYDLETAESRAKIDEFCKAIDFADCLSESIRLPIERRDYKLYAGDIDI